VAVCIIAVGGVMFEYLQSESWVCAAVCCSVWQCVAVCCSVLPCVAVGDGMSENPKSGSMNESWHICG